MKILLAAVNTTHTHSALALALIKSYWDRVPNRADMKIREYYLSQTIDEIASEIILLSPEVVAFSTYIWSQETILKVTDTIKSAQPKTFIILGGPEVSFNSEQIIKSAPWIDIIIRGEGERTFESVILSHIEGKPFQNIRGITFSENRKTISTQPAQLINNIDEIPSPFTSGIYKNGRGFTYYEASRGCPSKCSYCLSSVLGKLRFHSLERVKSDLDWFFKSDYTQIRFADRTFNFDEQRAIEILNYIKQKNNNKNFHFEIHADFLSNKIISILSNFPPDVVHLEIGIQSTNKKALESVNRPFNTDRLINQIIKLKSQTNCHIHLDVLGGLPYDSFSDFSASLNTVYSLFPDDIQVSLIKVLHGTPFQTFVKSNHIFCSSKPPYTITRTRWINSNEAILISDIGKLIDLLYNSGRFRKSIFFATTNLFSGNFSNLLTSLAQFWRNEKFAFYGLSPIKTFNILNKYFSQLYSANAKKVIPLLSHELLLTQKIPNFRENIKLPCFKTISKSQIKTTRSIKAFWFNFNLESLLNMETSSIESSYPELYYFENNPAKSTDTHLITRLSAEEKFITACLIKHIPTSEIPKVWNQLYKTKLNNLNESIDKLIDFGVLYCVENTSQKEAEINLSNNLNQLFEE